MGVHGAGARRGNRNVGGKPPDRCNMHNVRSGAVRLSRRRFEPGDATCSRRDLARERIQDGIVAVDPGASRESWTCENVRVRRIRAAGTPNGRRQDSE